VRLCSPGGGNEPGAAGELGDQPAGDRRRQQGVAVAHHADRAEYLRRRGVLEQEAAGACAQRGIDVVIEVEGGEHKHPWRVRRLAQPSRRVDAAEYRHPDVHQDNVGR
jgi:hypothetical protein